MTRIPWSKQLDFIYQLMYAAIRSKDIILMVSSWFQIHAFVYKSKLSFTRLN